MIASGVLGTSHVALAQPSAAVNRFVPAAHPRDGFSLRRGDVGGHLGWSASLHLDYANDPLVYESAIGDSDSEGVALVSDQLTSHWVGTLGLFEIIELAIDLPVHLVMEGEALGDQPSATGFGAGDLRLGALFAVHRSKVATVGISTVMTLGTGEGGDERPGVAGDSGATFAPAVHAALNAGVVSILAEVGARWRSDAKFAGIRFSDVLLFGLGLEARVVPDLLRAYLEARGESPLDDVGDRSTTPLGALLGAKLSLPIGLTLGAAGGMGLTRGYGSPDLRALLSVAYARDGEPQSKLDRTKREPAPEPVPEPEEPTTAPQKLEATPSEMAFSVDEASLDSDGDAVFDLEDRCPEVPGAAADSGCSRLLSYDPETGAIALLRPLHFAGSKLQPNRSPALEDIVALLRANPKKRVRVEAHALPPGRNESAITRTVERATAVGEWLIAQGVPTAQLELVGCGDRRPIAPDRGSQRFKNERVELWVIDPLPHAGMRSTLGCVAHTLPGQEPATPPPPPAPAPAPAPATPPPAAKPVAVAPAPPPAVIAGAATAAGVLAAIASAPTEDADRDGVANKSDACPIDPGKNNGCPETHRLDLEAGRIELLTPVRFDDGSDDFKAKPTAQLDELAATLRANPKMKLALLAHTAEEPDAAKSIELSRRRAKAIQSELTKRGAKTGQMRALGCGQTRPVAPNNVPWGRKKNDRLEVLVLDPAPSTVVHSLEGCMPSEGP